MTAFGDYARYYDVLYADKDYVAEAGYLDRLLRRHGGGRRILELGCGTGRHFEQLLRLGYAVTGVDMSAGMIEHARRRLPGQAANLIVGDLRTLRLPERFDAVLACFHVMNYLVSPSDFAAGLATARAHLQAGGLFVFDSWHGPAVRADPPGDREKRVHRDGVAIVRQARAAHWPETQRVDVHYRMTVHEGDRRQEFEETHRVRYLFPDEVARTCESAALELVGTETWLSGAPPDDRSWGVCYVTRAVDR